MSERYLLDTNAASAILRQREPICQRAASVPLSSPISAVTAGEMHYGVAKRPQAAALAKLVREFQRYTDILPWSDDIAPHYGTFRVALEVKGITIAPLDLMIAAHALAVDATLHQYRPGLGADRYPQDRRLERLTGTIAR